MLLWSLTDIGNHGIVEVFPAYSCILDAVRDFSFYEGTGRAGRSSSGEVFYMQ